ncbi:hypothetical protein [Paenibacillus sp. NEAU-GSW1]|uniref:hypothetical protein n=1 Tax=Paenibacillus sp. NEAU-GSW1 TaxID=2682486 RepID=UPI0012E31C1D|nr:hypothetical protein [Paenibacillus sp. NEAU-GSW1]MUT66861.1 hypothetical protein [Paenibacillus sp. NEAU-GSW1]
MITKAGIENEQIFQTHSNYRCPNLPLRYELIKAKSYSDIIDQATDTNFAESITDDFITASDKLISRYNENQSFNDADYNVYKQLLMFISKTQGLLTDTYYKHEANPHKEHQVELKPKLSDRQKLFELQKDIKNFLENLGI